MGTSKSIPTPKGGAWTGVKKDVTSFLRGGDVSADDILANTISAGGIASPPAFPSRSGARGASGEGGGGGGAAAGGGRSRGGTGGSARGGRASVGRAASGLGSFGAAVSDRGLDGALARLGLDELRGRSAVEVVARIAAHLADGVGGIQGEALEAALREAILEAAAMAGDPTYEDLDSSLQEFLSRDGVEGLVESFLTHYVFDRVWSLLESHVDRRAETNGEAEALATAVQTACRSHVEDLIGERQERGDFEALDWFGVDGEALGQGIVSDLEERIQAIE